MNINTAKQLISSFTDQWESSFQYYENDDGVVITIPILDSKNDHMSVFINEIEEGKLIITDLGETISEIEFVGYDLESNINSSIIKEITDGCGVSIENKEIFTIVSNDDKQGLYRSLYSIFDAMKTISSLVYSMR